MPEDSRSIELEIEVEVTPEEVWKAIATGPGISSWYIPHTVEEHEGGAAIASFGAGPEMQVPGRVAVRDPPRRVVFDGGEGVEGLAFEWLIEAKDAGTCIVRLVVSGFVSGSDWDDQYDAMTDGWQMFMFNLQQHFHSNASNGSMGRAPRECTCSTSRNNRATGITLGRRERDNQRSQRARGGGHGRTSRAVACDSETREPVSRYRVVGCRRRGRRGQRLSLGVLLRSGPGRNRRTRAAEMAEVARRRYSAGLAVLRRCMQRHCGRL